MKKGIHPENYRLVAFRDMSNGETFITRSCADSKETVVIDKVEYPLIKREITSSSHPFYTGKMKLVDSAGRVDKFYSRFEKSKIAANVFMPKDAPLANKMECIAFGANVELVDGFISDAGKASAIAAEKYDLFDISTLKEPFRVEGKKTMGLEIVEHLGWQVPDVIIYPTGAGTGIVGIWKAINELEKMGLVNDKKPRMVCVQAEGCSPLVDAFEKNKEYATPFENPKTLAAGMRVPLAVGDFIIFNI